MFSARKNAGLGQYKKYGFKDKSAVIRAALDRLQKDMVGIFGIPTRTLAESIIQMRSHSNPSLSINYRQEKFNNGALTVRSWPVMVTGLLYPLPIVYGAVGAGWYNTKFDFEPAGGVIGIQETKQDFG
ncbi:hypothetical protein L0337_03165 [candidate division KSB1 bacterium]|nr:hypothetical protein [candidate division KSB1 bacterium]